MLSTSVVVLDFETTGLSQRAATASPGPSDVPRHVLYATCSAPPLRFTRLRPSLGRC